MIRPLLSVFALCIFSAATRDAAAQTKSTNPLTTRSGVYTQEQASRGEDVYSGYCKTCHTAQTHTGATFQGKWNGKPLSELFRYIRELMPKNDPGSLSDQEYADVLSYVLKMNQMPAGQRELPVDSMAMRRIRIVTTKVSARKEK